jgi:hypothetical protein
LYVELPLDIETVFEWLLFRAWRKENLSIDNTHYIFYSQRTITSLLESTRFDCIKRWIWLLPSEKVNVLGVLAQKKRLSAVKTSKRLSWDFDLLGSGYFLRLYFKMIDKLRKQVTALKI